ncbi:MAG: CinA family protein [Chloroflexi bacterium]|nr:CinA family protein [Chloroflexota bacterium]
MSSTPALEIEVGQRLREQNLTFAAAESCTGGLLLHRLTNVPGSSAYIAGGIVAYSNAAKHSLLGVQEHSLTVFGAVSEQVAVAMARGVRAALASQIGIGITGIAGPDGGTPEKPVGLTYIGFSTPDFSLVRRFVWDGDRVANKESSVQAALQMILDYLISGK